MIGALLFLSNQTPKKTARFFQTKSVEGSFLFFREVNIQNWNKRDDKFRQTGAPKDTQLRVGDAPNDCEGEVLGSRYEHGGEMGKLWGWLILNRAATAAPMGLESEATRSAMRNAQIFCEGSRDAISR